MSTTQAMNIQQQDPKPTTTSHGLPTPNSLPLHSTRSHTYDDLSESLGTDNNSFNDFTSDFATSNSSNSYHSRRIETSGLEVEEDELTFDDEWGTIELGLNNATRWGEDNNILNLGQSGEEEEAREGQEQEEVSDRINRRNTSSTAFTSNLSAQRPFRSRYSMVNTSTSSQIPSPLEREDLPYRIPTPSTFKRSHSQVAISPPLEQSTSSSGNSSITEDPFSIFTRNTFTNSRPLTNSTTTTSTASTSRDRFSGWRPSTSFDSQRVSINSRSSTFMGNEDEVMDIRMNSSPIEVGSSRTVERGGDSHKRRRDPDSPFSSMDATPSTSTSSGSSTSRSRVRPWNIDPLLSTFRNLTSTSSNNTTISNPSSSSSSTLPAHRRRISFNSLNCLFPSTNSTSTATSTSSSTRLGSRRLRSVSPVTASLIGRTISRVPSTNGTNYRRATSTSYRVAPSVDFGLSSSTTGSNFRTESDSREEIRSIPIRRRFSSLNDNDTTTRRNEETTREVDQVLGNANDRLEAADSTLREAIRAIERDGVTSSFTSTSRRSESRVQLGERDDTLQRTVDFLERTRGTGRSEEDEVGAERMSDLSRRFPSTRTLPEPERSNEVPPIIGVRMGNRPSSSPTTQVPSPSRNLNRFSLAIRRESALLLSERRGNRFSTGSISRPQLARNASSVTPPELSPPIPITRSQIQDPFPWGDDEAPPPLELLGSARVTPSNGEGGGRSSLWGEVQDNAVGGPIRTTSHIGNYRLRGPTERSNELRRRRFEGLLGAMEEAESSTSSSPLVTPPPPSQSNNNLPIHYQMMNLPPRGVLPGRSNSPSPIRRSPSQFGLAETSREESLPTPPQSLFTPSTTTTTATSTESRRRFETLLSELHQDSRALYDRRAQFRNPSGQVPPPTQSHHIPLPVLRAPPFTRNSLADALAQFDPQATPTLARDDETDERSAARTTSEAEGLSAIRSERSAIRNLFEREREGEIGVVVNEASTTPTATATAEEEEAREVRRVGRRRGLGEMFRGIMGERVRGGRLAGFLLDSEFPNFFGRDSAALDPGNYLDDDDFDASYESLIQLSERIGAVRPRTSGISPEKLSSFQTFKYSDWPLSDREKKLQSSPSPSDTMAIDGDEDDVPLASLASRRRGTVELARKGVEKDIRCSICITDYEDDDEVLLSKCTHGFHADCLKAWLKDNNSCPVCRGET